MTRLIAHLAEIDDTFDVAVVDQWGVLHDGARPYPGVAGALAALEAAGKAIVVLSNSGKRAAVNRSRIERLGVPLPASAHIVTSGEALWADLDADRLPWAGEKPVRLLPICDRAQDAVRWAEGLGGVVLVADLSEGVDAILLMGLPDGADPADFEPLLDQAIDAGLPLICTNPDITSPRGGRLVTSPGALARRHEERGGQVIWYGKPHGPVFAAVMRLFGDKEAGRFAMIGDSLDHDIAGAAAAGFATVLVCGGIHAAELSGLPSRAPDRIAALARCKEVVAPDFAMVHLA